AGPLRRMGTEGSRRTARRRTPTAPRSPAVRSRRGSVPPIRSRAASYASSVLLSADGPAVPGQARPVCSAHAERQWERLGGALVVHGQHDVELLAVRLLLRDAERAATRPAAGERLAL